MENGKWETENGKSVISYQLSFDGYQLSFSVDQAQQSRSLDETDQLRNSNSLTPGN